MANAEAWKSQRSIDNRLSWRSQRPATPSSFYLHTPDDRSIDAVTWTRATTKSVTDYQGNVHQALSGEVTWQGYRRVRNHVIAPEDLDNGTYWSTASNVTVAAGGMTVPAGYGATAHTITEAATTASHRIQTVSHITGAANQTYILSAVIKRPTGDTRYAGLWLTNIAGTSQLRARIDPDTGTVYTEVQGNAVVDASGSEDLDGGIWRFWVVGRADTTAGDAAFYLAIVKSDGTLSYAGDTGEAMVFAAPQLERARPGQYTPSEYVSNGVLSTPYHGAKVDGVKYFTTDERGRPIDGVQGYKRITNLAKYSEDISNASWEASNTTKSTVTLLLATVATAVHSMTQNAGINCVVGAAYIVSFSLKKYSDSWVQVYAGSTAFGTNVWANVNLDTGAKGNSGGTGTWMITADPDDAAYWRVSFAATVTGVVTSYYAGIAFTGDTDAAVRVPSVATTTANGVHVTRHQIELAEQGQTTPSTYVPTNGAAVTLVEESSSVTPVATGLSIGSAQTNRITYSTPVTGWTTGTATATAAYDAQVGAYAQLRNVGAEGVAAVYIASSGFTGDARTEIAFMMRTVTATGSATVKNPQGAANGLWVIDLTKVSTTRFERIDRFHASVTISNEFTATAGGNSGVSFYRSSVTQDYDVALVTQVESQRVQSLIYSAGSVTTKNADNLALTAVPNLSTQNEGTLVIDYTPDAIYATSRALAAPAGYANILASGALGAEIGSFDGTSRLSYTSVMPHDARRRAALSWSPAGRSMYLDGAEVVTAGAYDGAWSSAVMQLTGPARVHALALYPSALTSVQGRAATEHNYAREWGPLVNESAFATMVLPDVSIANLRLTRTSGTTDVLFVGEDGTTVTKTVPGDTGSYAYTLSSDGLRGPVTMVVPASVGAALTQFYCGANQLTGSIPSLSGNTALQYFSCYSNQLTGSIPALSDNIALAEFICQSNQLTGSIPSLSANTALAAFACYSNQLTGSIPSLSSNTALQYFYCNSNQLTGSIPSLSANTALVQFYCQSNQLTGSIPSLSSNTALQHFFCQSNQLTGVAGGFAVPASLTQFDASTNQLPQAAIDAILAAFVTAGASNGTLSLNGTGNAAPSGSGATSKATLQSRGWTVSTN